MTLVMTTKSQTLQMLNNVSSLHARLASSSRQMVSVVNVPLTQSPALVDALVCLLNAKLERLYFQMVHARNAMIIREYQLTRKVANRSLVLTKLSSL